MSQEIKPNTYELREQDNETLLTFAGAAAFSGTCFIALALAALPIELIKLSREVTLDAAFSMLSALVCLILGIGLRRAANIFRATLRGDRENHSGIMDGLKKLSSAFSLYGLVSVLGFVFALYDASNKISDLSHFLRSDMSSFQPQEEVPYDATPITKQHPIEEPIITKLPPEDNRYQRPIAPEEFSKQVIEASNTGIVIVDVWASMCLSCRDMVPVVDETVKARSLPLVRVDLDKTEEALKPFGVTEAPTILAIQNGKVIQRISGEYAASTLANLLRNVTDPTREKLPETYFMYHLWPTEKSMFAVGDGVILQKKEGQWSVVKRSDDEYYKLWSSPGGLFVVGQSEILRSQDEGATFSALKVESDTVFFGITGDKSNLWLAGGAGTIMYSNDNGDTWVKQDSNTDEDFSDIWMAPNKVLYAVGTGGVIVRSEDGQTWKKQKSGTELTLNGVWGNKTLFAVGDEGTLLRSEDGQAWKQVELENEESFASVWGDGKNIYVVGEEQIILQSKDGGKTWTQAYQGDGDLYGINGKNGTAYAIGEDGVIITLK